MFLQKVSFINFRNYKKIHLNFSSKLNIFIGENGSGKTSFLEAIYCALRGRSFHSFIQDQFISKGEKNTKISLSLKEDQGYSEIQSSFFSVNSFFKKSFTYCGKKVRSSFFLKKIPCFVFTEASLKCIRQGPSERRTFIEDFFYLEEDLKIKEDFYRILKQKKQLLKNYKKALIQKSEFLNLLNIINQNFLEKSHLLVLARLHILNKIFNSVISIKESFFSSNVKLNFLYQIKTNLEINKQNAFSLLKQDLEYKKNIEIEAGIPLSGPQKHEILFLFNGEDSRTFCSKGQQRSYILSLFLSYIQSVPKALLFLDDVLLELDENIQERFLKLLEKNHCQIFLTHSKMLSFKIKKYSLFFVQKGEIKQKPFGNE